MEYHEQRIDELVLVADGESVAPDRVVPGSYIVVFKDKATKEEIDQYVKEVNGTGGQVGHRYENVIKGFSAKLVESQVNSLKANAIIDYIEPDQTVTIQPPPRQTQ